MRNVLLFTIVLLITQTIFAKTSFPLSGKVLDEKNLPLDWVSISLLNSGDSAFVQGTVTDSTGFFELREILPGEYILQISMLGYQKYFAKISVGDQPVLLGSIVLTADENMLEAVQVLAIKPTITNRGDKLIMNIENTILSTGGNAIDVLKRTPGVTVDNEDNIIVKGKQGVNIMVNDKQIYLAGDQLENYLKNLPADQIAQVEVISNPSAKYDAEGNAGIINIVLKKNRMEGVNGSVRANASKGYLWSYGGGANINYMNSKWNIVAGYNYDHPQYEENIDIERNIEFETDVTHIIENSQIDESDPAHNANIGIDYNLDEKNTIGISANGFMNETHTAGFTDALLTDEEGNFLSHSFTDSPGDGTYKNYALNGYYNGKLDTTGKQLTANIDYAYYDGNTINNFSTIYFNEDGTENGNISLFENDNPSTVKIQSAKLDYTHPLKKNLSLEAGLKSSFVVTDNEIISSYSDGGEWVIDSLQTNHFEYSENINAAYINFSKQFEKIQLSGGLRAEQTISQGNSLTLNDIVDRNYIDFFPSFSINDVLNEKNMLSLTYSKRINRPSYQDLNPFVYYLDPYVFVKGNPYLQPEKTHSFDLTYTFLQQYMLILSYSNTKDYIINLLYQNDTTNTTYQTVGNLDHFNFYGATVYTPFDVTKWLNLTPVITIYDLYQQENYEGADFRKNIISFNADFNGTVVLPKNFSVELSGHYENPGYWGIIKYESMWNLNLGVKKSLMDGKAIISLSASDIFDTNNFEGTFDVKNLDLYVYSDNDDREVKLVFTYNFGKTQSQSRDRTGGSEDEKNRVKMHN